jgi:glucose/arabinose dehydrogenase
MHSPHLRANRHGIAAVAVVATVAAALGVTLAGCQSTTSTSSGQPSTSSPTAPSTPTHTKTTHAPATSSPPSSAPATEFSPPGDIPDNQVFVPYTPPGNLVSIKVPEGWARSSKGGSVTFTDKLNSVTIAVRSLSHPVTPSYAQSHEVPQLQQTVSAFAMGNISTVFRNAGKAVLLTYEKDSAPSPVTGKVVRDAVEQYEFWKNGHEAVLTLSGPVGADNVDPWRIVSDSLTWK